MLLRRLGQLAVLTLALMRLPVALLLALVPVQQALRVSALARNLALREWRAPPRTALRVAALPFVRLEERCLLGRHDAPLRACGGLVAGLVDRDARDVVDLDDFHDFLRYHGQPVDGMADLPLLALMTDWRRAKTAPTLLAPPLALRQATGCATTGRARRLRLAGLLVLQGAAAVRVVFLRLPVSRHRRIAARAGPFCHIIQLACSILLEQYCAVLSDRLVIRVESRARVRRLRLELFLQRALERH